MSAILNSYKPLCLTAAGRRKAERHGIPPYVDGSIRREPDFECKYPSISGLCRCDKLLSMAGVGDVIVYVTVKGRGRHLVAILKVIETFPDHEAAARWYSEKIGKLPSNCVVPGNPPLPLEMALDKPCYATPEDWDKGYQQRAKDHPRFLACEAEFLELRNPPAIPEDIFGRPFPGTRNPTYISAEDLARLRALCGAEPTGG